jgi:hypothetical protein
MRTVDPSAGVVAAGSIRAGTESSSAPGVSNVWVVT